MNTNIYMTFEVQGVPNDLSLLHFGNHKRAMTLMRNLQLCCNGGGRMKATITTANKIGLASIDIDGGTDIGAALTTSDLIIVDDGAGGTNRKATLARLLTLTDGNATALAIALG